jgi:hypothetical protein
MKKIALLALAVSSAAIATPAMAATGDTVGTINIIGSVASKCTVLVGAGTSSTWGTSIDMLELADANGTLLPSAQLSNTFNSQANSNRIARVVCTTLAPKITVNAKPLVNSATVPTGYVNTVHFQADVAVTTVGGTEPTHSDDSLDYPTATGPTALLSALSASGDYVTISTSNWRTISNSGQQMVAGSYTGGQIVVTISPI